MSQDRTLISLAELVTEATRIVDPQGTDPAVTEFATRYEDADEPVRGILGELEERLRWGADDEPAVVVAQAVVLYLGHRPDETEEDPDRLLQLATRAAFGEAPDERIAAFLREVAAG